MENITSVKKSFCTEENSKLSEFNGKKYLPLLELDKLNKFQPLSIAVEFDNLNRNFVVLLFKDKVLAFENSCPHQHRPSLHLGYVKDDCIVCPEHGWSFDLNTGGSVNNKLSVSKLHFLDVLVVGGIIYINVDNLGDPKWNFT